jgi:membrane protein YdbS with pleckstrin-like domain
MEAFFVLCLKAKKVLTCLPNKTAMKKNMGNVDMIVRLALAVIMIACYFVFNLKDLLGLIVILITILLVVTAFLRVCPLYYVFRTDTLKKENKE